MHPSAAFNALSFPMMSLHIVPAQSSQEIVSPQPVRPDRTAEDQVEETAAAAVNTLENVASEPVHDFNVTALQVNVATREAATANTEDANVNASSSDDIAHDSLLAGSTPEGRLPMGSFEACDYYGARVIASFKASRNSDLLLGSTPIRGGGYNRVIGSEGKTKKLGAIGCELKTRWILWKPTDI
ncbi:hypothetical protein VTL71DRAFT_10369 [Oculimacula yallundae]|uniref:Uncharacterized protein n=1 Tax=Oculimacula yallundae TaxID=86028 RepID=A0ABR4CT65_9HELO